MNSEEKIKLLEHLCEAYQSQLNQRGKEMMELRADLIESTKSQLKLYEENAMLKAVLLKYTTDEEYKKKLDTELKIARDFLTTTQSNTRPLQTSDQTNQ